MMVGVGTIFSDIIRDNPTIKNKVGERALNDEEEKGARDSICCVLNALEARM